MFHQILRFWKNHLGGIQGIDVVFFLIMTVKNR